MRRINFTTKTKEICLLSGFLNKKLEWKYFFYTHRKPNPIIGLSCNYDKIQPKYFHENLSWLKRTLNVKFANYVVPPVCDQGDNAYCENVVDYDPNFDHNRNYLKGEVIVTFREDLIKNKEVSLNVFKYIVHFMERQDNSDCWFQPQRKFLNTLF